MYLVVQGADIFTSPILFSYRYHFKMVTVELFNALIELTDQFVIVLHLKDEEGINGY